MIAEVHVRKVDAWSVHHKFGLCLIFFDSVRQLFSLDDESDSLLGS
jgi:hypothetical protein